MNQRILIINNDTSDSSYSNEAYLINYDSSYITLTMPMDSFKSKLQDDALYEKLKEAQIYPMKGIDEEASKSLYSEMQSVSKEEFYSTFNMLSFSVDDLPSVFQFLKENEDFIRDKKIVLPGLYDLTEKSYLKFLEMYTIFSDMFPEESLYVNVKNSYRMVKLSDYDQAYYIVKEIVDLVNALGLSPLEKIMFVYDIVKKRTYKESEDNLECRDFVLALLYDSIVCVGFSQIFKAILENLNIKVTTTQLSEREDSVFSIHERNVIFVDDPKYNVFGHFFFDVTGDSKKEGIDNQNEYKFFLKTFNQINIYDKHHQLYSNDLNFLYPEVIAKAFRELSDDFDLVEYKKIFKTTHYNKFVKNIGLSERTIDVYHNDKISLLKMLDDVYKSFNLEIDNEQFFRLVNNVRKIEYYLDPEHTDYSVEALKECIHSNLYKFVLLDPKVISFLLPLLNINEQEFIEREEANFMREVLDENLEREIAGVKLARSLKKKSLKKES